MSEHVAQDKPHLGAVRFSRLKKMGRSAKIYRAQFDRPDSDTPDKRFGRLVHAIVLTGKVAVFDGKRNTNAFDAFEAGHPGHEICLRHEHNRALEIRDALMAHDEARRLLTGLKEVEIAWTDSSRACGARLDVLGEERVSWTETLQPFVCDLKTTASAEPRWFARNAERMGYHAQLDWYRQGASHALRRPVLGAYIVAVEPKYPYEIVTFPLGISALDHGERLWRSWWEKLMNCERSDVWPGYSDAPYPWEVTGNSEIDFDE